MQSKRWPARRYAEALSILGKDPNCIFVLIGNESDRPLAGQISRESSARVISAIGATLLQTSGILSRVQLYLGNDTGPMHMAALHGIPCVVIFSARDRAGKWHPPGDHHVFLRADAPCAGCMLKECFSEPALCLFDVPVERVVEAARRALKLEMVPATVVIS
jgi:ADP-heptose:LPS heptosyltransferase